VLACRQRGRQCGRSASFHQDCERRTAGSAVYALSLGSSADGAVSVTTTGAIITFGPTSDGVYVYSLGGQVIVTVATVTTFDQFADGIYAKSFGAGADGAVSATATGTISTGDNHSKGVIALSYGSGADGAVSVTETGTVSTAGGDSRGV